MSETTEETKDISKLEEEFKTLVAAHKGEIEAKVAEAEAALAEACRISSEYGIPFAPGISFLSQTYTPEKFTEKFGEIDEELVYELTETYPGDSYGDGWQHSAVC